MVDLRVFLLSREGSRTGRKLFLWHTFFGVYRMRNQVRSFSATSQQKKILLCFIISGIPIDFELYIDIYSYLVQ